MRSADNIFNNRKEDHEDAGRAEEDSPLDYQSPNQIIDAIVNDNLSRFKELVSAGVPLFWSTGNVLELIVATNRQKFAWELLGVAARLIDDQNTCPGLKKVLEYGDSEFDILASAILRLRPDIANVELEKLETLEKFGSALIKCPRFEKLVFSGDFQLVKEPCRNILSRLMQATVGKEHLSPEEFIFLEKLTTTFPKAFGDAGCFYAWHRLAMREKNVAAGMLLLQTFCRLSGLMSDEVTVALNDSVFTFLKLVETHKCSKDELLQVMFEDSVKSYDTRTLKKILAADRRGVLNLRSAFDESKVKNDWKVINFQKLCVEHGHSTENILFAGVSTGAYFHLIRRILSPNCDIFIEKLLPPHMFSKVEESLFYRKNVAFKFLSSCAACAAYINGHERAGTMFIDFVKSGLKRLEKSEKRPARLNDILIESNQAFEGLRGIKDVVKRFYESVLIPLQQSYKLEQQEAEIQRGIFKDYNRERAERSSYSGQKHFDLGRIGNRGDENERVHQIASNILFRDCSVLEISRLVRAWHRLARHHPNNHSLPVEWYPIIPETRTSPNYSFVAPVTPAALIDEGKAMQNCLITGLYASECQEGSIAILSMRYMGSPIATLTLAPTTQNGPWQITESQGRNHAELSPQEEEQIKILQDMLNDGRVKVGASGVGETLESRAANVIIEGSTIKRAPLLSKHVYPKAALAFYSHVVKIQSNGRLLPLLRPFAFDIFLEDLSFATSRLGSKMF